MNCDVVILSSKRFKFEKIEKNDCDRQNGWSQRREISYRRPCPHVSGYFRIRNFFVPDSKISPSTRSGENTLWKTNLYFTFECRNFSFSKIQRTWSFHVVVLQRTAKKCTKILNARAQSLFCSLNLWLVSLSSKSPSWFAKTAYCSVRDWTRFLRHRIKKYPDSSVHTLSDSLRIYFFPLWRAYLFFSGFAVEFAGYVWTVADSGTKKLRIRKYPDTCGRGLNLIRVRMFKRTKSYRC